MDDKGAVFWDRELPGFGVRVYPSGSKVYMVHKRSGGESRRVTIGRHGVWSLDAARSEAGGIIARLKNGETPARPGGENGASSGPTIAELAEQYMAEHVAVRCKPTTERSCRHTFDRYLLPQLGKLPSMASDPTTWRPRGLHKARQSAAAQPRRTSSPADSEAFSPVFGSFTMKSLFPAQRMW